MATQAKIDHVAELVEKIKKAQSVVLVDYQGISVNDETALRRKMREAGAEYLVTKNRLFKIALKEAGVEDSFEDILEGTTAFAFGYTDPVAPAKIVFDLAKDKWEEVRRKETLTPEGVVEQAKALYERYGFKDFKLKGGVLTGKRVEAEGVEALAKLPSRDQLLSMLLNSMLGPIRKLAYATVAIADKKEATAE